MHLTWFCLFHIIICTWKSSFLNLKSCGADSSQAKAVALHSDTLWIRRTRRIRGRCSWCRSLRMSKSWSHHCLGSSEHGSLAQEVGRPAPSPRLKDGTDFLSSKMSLKMSQLLSSGMSQFFPSRMPQPFVLKKVLAWDCDTQSNSKVKYSLSAPTEEWLSPICCWDFTSLDFYIGFVLLQHSLEIGKTPWKVSNRSQHQTRAAGIITVKVE